MRGALIDGRTVLDIGGSLLVIMGLLMLGPLVVEVFYLDGHIQHFLFSMALVIPLGLLLKFFGKGKNRFGRKEVYLGITLGWLGAALAGALPFWFSPGFVTFTDAFFESMSGLTTTGATILTDIEAQSHAILFWRSFLQWLGGIGIIVLFISVLPSLGVGGILLFKAEVPGPTHERLQPRIRETAKTLLSIYLTLTGLQTLLLLMGGLSFYDALLHSFTTVSTGGFSPRQASVGAWSSPFVQMVILIFMIAAGTNFALYSHAIRGRVNIMRRDAEFKFYLAILLVATMAVGISLYASGMLGAGDAALKGSFHVVSITTTTGFTTADYELWPFFSKALLVMLMFVGGSAGSTGGSMKIARILIVLDHARLQIWRFLRPRGVAMTKLNNIAVSSEVLNSILGFITIYLLVFVMGTLIMAALELDLISAGTAVAATLGNVGPGLEMVGPTLDYHAIPTVGKWVLSVCMLLGRLELFPIFVLFLPAFWRRY